MMVNAPHWTSAAPVNPGWYWYRDRSHPAVMLRIDSDSVINSAGEFDDLHAADLAGDWWSARIKASL
jgi:hypothetical protein